MPDNDDYILVKLSDLDTCSHGVAQGVGEGVHRRRLLKAAAAGIDTCRL